MIKQHKKKKNIYQATCPIKTKLTKSYLDEAALVIKATQKTNKIPNAEQTNSQSHTSNEASCNFSLSLMYRGIKYIYLHVRLPYKTKRQRSLLLLARPTPLRQSPLSLVSTINEIVSARRFTPTTKPTTALNEQDTFDVRTHTVHMQKTRRYAGMISATFVPHTKVDFTQSSCHL